ncbi:hypothetical protein SAMN00017405_2136 [Desulfonispora thiosulfatigenes DSM 11270]|uniref:DUF2357 domain-containing protein n=1 Tax=Desulfonispora thiosulfatigenes DSM 11270 TaxID=656914 RepID=A0A1W1UJW3_DESTI|nr:DUF2357 domain-containing protein [Desulfonispora thiosulfatigenes]SMB81415.1 hypothetical protein SAMN00017405_2136 [Desulfonispora thiosulfatigenes DSM 11270]
MDSLHSGNHILVSIETESLYLTLTGKYKDYGNTENKFQVFCQDEFMENFKISEGPILFEYTNYELIIEKKFIEDEIEFYHENILLRNQINFTSKSKRVLSGIINFQGDIGLTELVIMLNKKRNLVLLLEVFPTKIDYKDDYQQILHDVNEEIYNLSFDFLKRTYLQTSLIEKNSSSLTEFYSILQLIINNFMQALKIINSNPHHKLIKNEQVLPFHKTKKYSSKTTRWLEKNPQNVMRKGGHYVAIKALEIRKENTVDTYENQFTKYMVLEIAGRLKEFRIKYLSLNREQDELIVKSIDNIIKSLNRIMYNDTWKKVSKFAPKDSSSLVIKMAPGYKDIYKYYLMLKKGLRLQGDMFNLSIKDLSVLYEYWCFIKINSILKKKYQLLQTDLIKINNNGVFVTLKKGKNTSAKYLNPQNGEVFTVSYNLGMESVTVGQKPDNVFSLKKANSDVKYNYIFDAKYKVDFKYSISGEKKLNGATGPMEEDINAMHRYRDAIIHTSKNTENQIKRDIFGAYVLFPYKNETEYKEHKFYKSIKSVNIGGFPFLPTATNLMEEFLDELIKESSYSSFERSIEQIGTTEYLKPEYYKQRNVLLGTLSNGEQLTINLNNNFYHTRLKNINMYKNNLEYIAIYQSKNLFKDSAGIKYYGKIKNIIVLPRKEIKELPQQIKKADNLYVKFEVEKWEVLHNPILIKGNSLRTIMYTTYYLLKNCEFSEELCIKDELEFRLWMELKRWSQKVQVSLEKDNSNIASFKIDDKIVHLDDKEIVLIYKKDQIKKISLQEFSRTPGKIIRDIIRT